MFMFVVWERSNPLAVCGGWIDIFSSVFLILEIRGQILTPKQRIELREMLVRVGIIADGMWLHT